MKHRNVFTLAYTCCLAMLLLTSCGSWDQWAQGLQVFGESLQSASDQVNTYNGGGYSSSYSTSSSSFTDSGSTGTRSSRTQCSRCKGSGVCKGCSGSKGEWKYVDRYTGDGTKSFIKCGECRGSGKCPICHGRGTL